jgi:DNA-binding MarR family transcriptional regulator
VLKGHLDRIPLPILLLQAGVAYSAAMRSALAAAGFDDIPRNGVYVIGGLAYRSRAVALSQLINELKLSKQATGQLADALVAGGYITREVNPGDRRRLMVALTDRGREAAMVLGAARRAVDAKLLALTSAADVERTRRTLSVLGGIDLA